MPRRVQDIVPGDRRSIRNVPVERPSTRARAEETDAPVKKTARSAAKTAPTPRVPEPEAAPEPVREKTREIPIRRMPITPPPSAAPRRAARGGGGKWALIVIGIVIIVAGIGFVASSYFSRATFTIVPKTVAAQASGTYIAQATPGNSNVLVYELVTVTGSTTATVPATDGQKVSTKAEGTVTVYNAYSAQSQRLVAGTRLSDDAGRIYRLTSSIVIPGYTKPAGSAIIPGTASATIVADQPGESYNILRTGSISDFKIVAYKGTPKYQSMYARQTSDIDGGFVGVKKVVNPSVLATTTQTLKAQLTAQLLAQAQSVVPEGYILYDEAYVPSFSSPAVGGADPKSAQVTLQGSLTGVLINKEQLARRIAGEQALRAFGNFNFEPSGLENLEVSIANPKEFSPAKKNTLLLRIQGTASLIGVVPVDEIKSKLAGVSLAETQNVLKPYSQVISSGSGELVPPWSKVPSDLGRISVVIDGAKEE